MRRTEWHRQDLRGVVVVLRYEVRLGFGGRRYAHFPVGRDLVWWRQIWVEWDGRLDLQMKPTDITLLQVCIPRGLSRALGLAILVDTLRRLVPSLPKCFLYHRLRQSHTSYHLALCFEIRFLLLLKHQQLRGRHCALCGSQRIAMLDFHRLGLRRRGRCLGTRLVALAFPVFHGIGLRVPSRSLACGLGAEDAAEDAAEEGADGANKAAEARAEGAATSGLQLGRFAFPQLLLPLLVEQLFAVRLRAGQVAKRKVPVYSWPARDDAVACKQDAQGCDGDERLHRSSVK